MQVWWWLGPSPPYLDRSRTMAEVQYAVSQWASAVPLHFVHTPDAEKSDLVITWGDHTPHHEFRFSGPGGALAATRPGSITLDIGEVWRIFACGRHGVWQMFGCGHRVWMQGRRGWPWRWSGC